MIKVENLKKVFRSEDIEIETIALLMAFGSVLWQTLRTAKTNPVDVLQKE
jgi:hypothetical protein